jgi:hypothetical protein
MSGPSHTDRPGGHPPVRRASLVLALGVLAVGLPLPTATALVPVPLVDTTRIGPGLTRLRLDAATRMVAVTWTAGTPEVSVRWRSGPVWSRWHHLDPEQRGAASARPGTEPAWLPEAATDVEVGVQGRATGVRLVEVGERLARRRSTPAAAAATTTGRARLGRVVTRAEWGADERLRKKPKYGPRVEALVVHHTVSGDDYSAAEAAAVVRGVYAYHVKSRGYSDIAYNLLADRFGRVYEGRAGGIDRPVVGSHTLGFNERTTAVALLGDLEARAPSAALLDATARVGAFVADTWRLDPRGSVALTSKGSTRFRRGTRVVLPRVMGHRDTAATACPGINVYRRLGELRAQSWRYLAPVITDVVVSGSPVRPPQPATVSARLTATASWRLELRAPLGLAVVAVAEGRGRDLRLAWDGMLHGGVPAPPGEYTWTATADDGVHGPSDPVTGTLTVAVLSPA